LGREAWREDTVFETVIGGRVLSRALKDEDERDLGESSSNAEMCFLDAFTPLYY